MQRYGFIHDKLEIKFLVLYVMCRVPEPIDFNTITELVLFDPGIDYFEYAQSVAEMAESGHLQKDADGLYSITQKGIKSGEICESSLPYSVRIKAEKNIAELTQRIRRRALVKAAIRERDNGYTVRLSLDDGIDNILTMELMTASRLQAEKLEANFLSGAERIYNGVLSLLLAPPGDKK